MSLFFLCRFSWLFFLRYEELAQQVALSLGNDPVILIPIYLSLTHRSSLNVHLSLHSLHSSCPAILTSPWTSSLNWDHQLTEPWVMWQWLAWAAISFSERVVHQTLTSVTSPIKACDARNPPPISFWFCPITVVPPDLILPPTFKPVPLVTDTTSL